MKASDALGFCLKLHGAHLDVRHRTDEVNQGR